MLSKATSRGAIEIIEPFDPRPQISHAIFDFDGTVSWLRHGWPDLMYRVFRRHFTTGEDASVVHDLLLDDILSLNGKASIFQMIRCAERVRERGGVAPDPHAMLAEYQQLLGAAVAERTSQIRGGQSKPDDFVVHGARDMLTKLCEREVTLIILSGSPEPQVRSEAELLQLSHLFGSHIYGATNDLAGSSKQAVIERILREEQIGGEHLVSFGDGPVEMRLTRAAGGLAIGVASDEDRNGSGLVHTHKRKHLVSAEAQLVVPDYRDAVGLMEQLFGA